jgi:hypothetical protein
MRTIRETIGALLREVGLGAGLGLCFLGIGGRIAMRANAIALGQSPMLNAGGTFTVVVAGAAAGAAGALLYALSRAAATRLAGGHRQEYALHAAWERPLRLVLFAVLLAFVTSRGLSGSPGPTWPFWLLVAAYGAALDFVLLRRSRDGRRPSSRVDAPAAAPMALAARLGRQADDL